MTKYSFVKFFKSVSNELKSISTLCFVVFSFMMVCIPQSLLGQTQSNSSNPERYFHQGAQEFIYNNLEAAIDAVETGLKQYPNDLKLQRLYEQLKEQQEEEQNSQDQQNSEGQNEENSEQNSEQDQQNPENEEDSQQNEENSENEEQPSENNEQNEGQDEKAPKDAQSTERLDAEELKDLSKEEAQKILQALAQKEKELLKEFKKAKTKGGKTHEKDW